MRRLTNQLIYLPCKLAVLSIKKQSACESAPSPHPNQKKKHIQTNAHHFMWLDPSLTPFPHTVFRMKEIRFGDGEAGATSVDSTWVPANAFKFNQPISTGWHTGKRGGPPHTLPVMIWYDLKNDGVIPAEVKKNLYLCSFDFRFFFFVFFTMYFKGSSRLFRSPTAHSVCPLSQTLWLRESSLIFSCGHTTL